MRFKIGQHFEQQVLFANMAPAAVDVAKVLDNKTFREALGEYDKDFYRDVILPWYSRSVTQNIYNGMPKRDAEEHWMNKVRSKAGIAAMFMNIINAVEGFFDLTAAYARVKAGHLHHAFGKMVTDRKATLAMIMEMSPYMRERLQSESNKAAARLDQALHPDRLKKIDNWINDHAYFMQEIVDGFTAPVVFLGAFNQAKEGGLGDAEAVAQAESVVRSVYGTMMPEDLANREAGPVWKRLFTQFTGYFVQRINMIASEHMKRKRDIESTAKQHAVVAILYLCTVFFPAWIGAGLRKFAAGSDDDNWTWQQWLKDVFGWGTMSYVSGLANVTVPGQIVTSALETMQGGRMASGRVFSSPATQMIGQAVMNVKFWKEGEGVQGKKLFRFLTAAANLCPFVPVVPNRPVATMRYLNDVFVNREVRPTSAYDFARGAVTGRASPDSRQ